MTHKLAILGLAISVVTGASCGRESALPASPTTEGAAPVDQSANSDGSLLKATAPTALTPIDGQRLEQADTVTLTVSNAATKFGVEAALSYRFQILSPGGTVVAEGAGIAPGPDTTSFTVSAQFEGDQIYRWHARVEADGVPGPWSAPGSFVVAPQPTTGYVRGAELYDPLTNGSTIGQMHGPLTFIPGVGVKLESHQSYISYELPATLSEGEFSILVTGMPANTDGDKTKLFAMASGYGDIVTNDRRMTVEKRGDPAGVVAWRFITHGDQVDTEGPEREFVNFLESQTYFWEATWRNNRFNLLIREGGVNGPRIYEKGKNFEGRAYDPNPHVIYIGAPVGRSGDSGASVDQAIIRQVWVSARRRPAFANK